MEEGGSFSAENFDPPAGFDLENISGVVLYHDVSQDRYIAEFIFEREFSEEGYTVKPGSGGGGVQPQSSAGQRTTRTTTVTRTSSSFTFSINLGSGPIKGIHKLASI